MYKVFDDIKQRSLSLLRSLDSAEDQPELWFSSEKLKQQLKHFGKFAFKDYDQCMKCVFISDKSEPNEVVSI